LGDRSGGAPPPDEPKRRKKTPLLVGAGVVIVALVAGGAGAALEHQLGDDSGSPQAVASQSPSPATSAPTAPDESPGTQSAPQGQSGQQTQQAPSANQLPSGSVEKVAATVTPSVVSIIVSTGSGGDEGSGIVLTKDGKILTNDHVIAAAANGQGAINVRFSDGTSADASIIGADAVTDLAVIQAKGVSDAKPVQIGKSGDLAVGQPVVAIGSPLGLYGTVTSGIVSALQRPIQTESPDQLQPGYGQGGFNQPQQQTVIDAIQTDAAINPGNSGGPLVNMNSQVVGINQSIATAGSGTGQSGSIGVGFAIPIDQAMPVVQELMKGQKATHAQLGVDVRDAADQNGLPIGARVIDVISGQPGASAGLQAGDVITKVDDRQVDSSDALIAAVRSHRPGDTVTVTFQRSSSSHSVKVKLGSDG
jgi:putative serine protease PepD